MINRFNRITNRFGFSTTTSSGRLNRLNRHNRITYSLSFSTTTTSRLSQEPGVLTPTWPHHMASENQYPVA